MLEDFRKKWPGTGITRRKRQERSRQFFCCCMKHKLSPVSQLRWQKNMRMSQTCRGGLRYCQKQPLFMAHGRRLREPLFPS
jgi:hypothetical protein